MADDIGRAESLLDSLRNFARTFIGVLQTRLEIFASELDEQRDALARIAVLAAVASFCLALAVMLAVLLVVVIFWDTNRLLAIGIVTAVFSTAGLIALGMLYFRLKDLL